MTEPEVALPCPPVGRQSWLTALSFAATDLRLPSHGAERTLVVLASKMGQDGRVTVSRADLAVAAGYQQRSVSRHLSMAVAAGLLVRVSGGVGRGVSTYQATAPSRTEATGRADRQRYVAALRQRRQRAVQ